MAGNNGFFSPERRAWIAVILYTLFLYSTLSLAFDLYMSIYRRIGRDSMSLSINSLFLIAGVLLMGWVFQASSRRMISLVAFLLIALTTALCLWQLEVPAKRIHFFQYAPLTLLTLRAVSFRCRERSRYAWTLALVTLIGVGDESIQGMLERRHFGWIDAMVNSLAGLLTLGFLTFVIGGDNFLESSRPRPPS